MNIPLFSFLMATTYISFFEGVEVESWAKKLGERLSRFRATIFLPVGKRFNESAANAIAATDPLGLVTYEEGDATWRAVSGGKEVKPFRASLARSVGAWIIGTVPYLWKRLLTGALEDAPDEPQSTSEHLVSRKKKRVTGST
jgi:hypothetical protein